MFTVAKEGHTDPHIDGPRELIEEKRDLILLSNTISDPEAMVVESLNAAIAIPAVF